MRPTSCPGSIARCVSTTSNCWTRPKRSSAVLKERQRPAIERARTAAAQGSDCLNQLSSLIRPIRNGAPQRCESIRTHHLANLRSARTPFILLGSGPAFGEISPTLPQADFGPAWGHSQCREITPGKSRYIWLAENRLRQRPQKHAPRVASASPGVPRRHGAPVAPPLAYSNSAQATSGAGACWCVVAGAWCFRGWGEWRGTSTQGGGFLGHFCSSAAGARPPSPPRALPPARSYRRWPADLVGLNCLALLRCRDRGFTLRLFAGLRVRVTPVQRCRWKERRFPGLVAPDAFRDCCAPRCLGSCKRLKGRPHNLTALRP